MSLLRSSLASNSMSRMAAWVVHFRLGAPGPAFRCWRSPPFLLFPSAMSLILLFVLSMSTFPGIPVFSSGFSRSTPPLRSSASPLSLLLPLRDWLGSIGLSVVAVRYSVPASTIALGSGGSDTLVNTLAGLLRPVHHFLERQFGCPGFADVFPVAHPPDSSWAIPTMVLTTSGSGGR